MSNHVLRNATIGVAAAAVVLTALLSGSAWAQDAANAPPTGDLVVVPQSVDRGQTTLAVGFHVEPADLEVKIEYSGHFTPEGESCDDAGTPGATTSAVAPTWVTLNACTVGDGYARLVASDTGVVIETVNVTVVEPDPDEATGQTSGREDVSHSGIGSGTSLVVGESHSFTARATQLDSLEVYDLHTVVLNNRSLAFDSSCSDRREERRIRNTASYSVRYTVWACSAHGSIIWSYLEVNGSAIDGTPLTDDNRIGVVEPTPTITPTPTPTDTPTPTPTNTPPEITSGPSSVTYDECETRSVGTYRASDDDGDSINWSLPNTSFETDRNDFDISSSGVLTFDDAPDYENPGDSDGNNVYKVTVRASDGEGGTDDRNVTITVTNEDPTITSGKSSVTYDEGDTDSVERYLASDPCGGDISWSLPNTSFELDRNDFDISDIGLLTFDDTPDYENPDDSNDDNVYKITVRASDGAGGTDSINVTVTVRNEDPTITSGPSSASYAEGGTGSVGRYRASDPGGGRIIWSLPNTSFETDRNDFDISSSGVVTFEDTPDYENPDDSNDDNVYKITVRASDGEGGRDDRNVTITVTNVNEAPTFSDGASATRSVAENTGSGMNFGAAVSATDPDGDTLSYSLGTADFANFSIDTSTGQLKTKAALDHEVTDSYSITVTVTDGNGGSDSIAVTITVTDVNEAPTFKEAATPTPTRSVAENTGSGMNIGDPVSATEPDDGDTLTYSLSGTDASSFQIVAASGQLQTKAGVAYDHETKSSYSVTVSVTDGKDDQGDTEQSPTTDDSIAVTITVTDVNEPPTFNEAATPIPTRSVAENTGGGMNIDDPVSATDPDDGDTLTYSLSGTDASSFQIVRASGQLQTKAGVAYDHETKSSYSVTVSVTDGKDDQGKTELSPVTDASIVVTINVTNVDEAGVVSLSPLPIEVGTAVTATLSDPDGGVSIDSWQWERSRTGGSWSDIFGETSNSYTPDAADQGYRLRVSVAYDDMQDTDKSAVSTAFTVIPVQVATPTLTPGDMSLEVDWTAVGTGLSAPDRYEVEYKLSTATDMSWVRGPAVTPPTIEATITTLMNGAAYNVRVRACNSGGCGPWSPTVTATPKAKLAAPTDLDVVPMALRKARLTWTASANADSNTEYEVQMEDASSSTGWTTVATIDHPSTGHDIALDDAFNSETHPANSLTGLALEDHFDFKVVSKDPTGTKMDSDDSDTIRIMDNPIYRADGDSRGRSDNRGQATLRWMREPHVMGGEYTIRYWKLPRSDSWRENKTWRHGDKPNSFATSTKTDPRIADPKGPHPDWLEHTIPDSGPGLDLGEIYAVQLYYDTSSRRVFSARDVYVWPATGFPGHTERIGTYPFFGHWTERTYDYTICEDTFPSSTRSGWESLIEHAFERWEEATDGLVELNPSGLPCPQRNTVIQILSGVFRIISPLPEVTVNEALSEVYMVDTSGWDGAVSAFTEFMDNPLSACVFDARACVVSKVGYLNPIRQAGTPLYSSGPLAAGVDILINKSKAEEMMRTQDIPRNDDVQFNTCEDAGKNFSNYELMVHEVGHALGLSDWDPVDNIISIGVDNDREVYEASHPTIADSVLNYDRRVHEYHPDISESDNFEEPNCFPHQFDIMAIYALYQTHDIQPSAPRNLQASATHDAVTLTWDAPDKGEIEGYRISRLDSLGSTSWQVHVAHTGSVVTSYVDRNVTANRGYVYSVQAIAVKGFTIGERSHSVRIRTDASP